MPMTDRIPESKPVRACPGHDSSCWAAGGTLADAGAESAKAVSLSFRPP